MTDQWLLRPDALHDARDAFRHKTTVRLTYTNGGNPYKWESRCQCGWHGLSWQWRRVDEEEGDLPYVTGALALALEHVGLLPNTSPYRPRYATGGIVKAAGSATDDTVPFQFSGCRGFGYEIPRRKPHDDHSDILGPGDVPAEPQWTYTDGQGREWPVGTVSGGGLIQGPGEAVWNQIVELSRGLDGHKPWPVDYDPAATFGLDNDWVCVTCALPLRMESIRGDGPEFAHEGAA